MKTELLTTKKIMITAIVAGLTGGGLLILKSVLVRNGYLDIAICAIVMLFTFIVALTRNNTKLSFKKWLITGTLSFTIMSLVMYLYVLIIANPNNGIPLIGHLLRLAAIVACGAISSAILGLFLLKRKPALQGS